ncbi:hypothetical protein B0H13DRAFT_2378001 [Mycena leptocephala]|nr:hypothetical protein B0H13DRAFT_2378001 [Mycena leptocephala]
MHDADDAAAHRTHRSGSQYIDDSAEVDHDPRMRDEDASDDEDSYEAQLRRQDREDFAMELVPFRGGKRLRSLGACDCLSHRDFTLVPSITLPVRPRSASPEPPAKKRRVESGADASHSPDKPWLHRFFDVSAEDSDEDGEEEDEEEDEETLSDKEFLDDEPVHDDLQRRRPVFLEEEETEDDLRALAAAYEVAGREYSRAARQEQSVAPVRPPPAPTVCATPAVADNTLVPETWVMPKHGLHKGRLALVLTKRKFLVAPVSLSETTIILPFKKFVFGGHCPALAEGDRVVVVAGPHQGETGFIVMLREVPVDHQRVKYAKIVKVYNGVDIVKKGDTSLYIRVAHLERHGLDVPCAMVVQDRVRVVSGALFRGATGHVIDNCEGYLTVAADRDLELTGATAQSEISDRKVFQISIRYVNRDFRRGDLVRVRTGKHEGRVGLIVATFTGGSIEVFDFQVRAADVDFATFDERASGLTIEHAGISSYTATSHVAALKAAPPRARDEDTEQHATPKVVNAKHNIPVLCRRLSRLLAKPDRTEEEHRECASLAETITKLHRVAFTSRWPGEAITKGFVGQSSGDHDSEARVRRLATKRAKGEDRWYEDQEGIVVTIRNEMGQATVNIPVDKCIHEFTTLPLTKACFLPHDVLMGNVAARERASLKGSFPREKTPPPPCTPSPPPSNDALWASIPQPPLPGEDDGGWMCIPSLGGKRFDVQVVGITGVKERTSATLLALEGRHGHILANAPIQPGTKKLDVCGVGKTGTKHAVYVQCIKPRRKDDNGRSLSEISERVVVIGPDMGEGTLFEGCYGLTQPEVPHFYDSGIVCVKVELPVSQTFDTAFFATTSLCMAKNVALTYGGQPFPATTFPE